ncbi:unnamed protein product [Notodromas monacha]|uniref:Uncharacterized protein n=1 Tax=Notodromas monacha TaxID=399045 RepID=A0A7R9BT93_9CRUS|nr:unnamed protein product [Notodromas monacha]CAG0919709.1 unnamed protein product [Notodromas monacha]
MKWCTSRVRLLRAGFSRSVRGVTSGIREDTTTAKNVNEVQPFEAIPGPLTVPVFGNLLHYKLGIFRQPEYHKVLRKLHQTYGPICRQKFGSETIVSVFDPNDIRTVYQSEGKTPTVPPLQETTQLYRLQRNMSPGLGNT